MPVLANPTFVSTNKSVLWYICKFCKRAYESTNKAGFLKHKRELHRHLLPSYLKRLEKRAAKKKESESRKNDEKIRKNMREQENNEALM